MQIRNTNTAYPFILNHYGKIYKFTLELCQSLGITTLEDDLLRNTRISRQKFEKRCSYAFVGLCSLPFYKLFKKTNNMIFKIGIILFFGIFVTEFSYNIGRHIGGFLIMKPIMNRLLNVNKGESILALQSLLFIKTCLIEDLLINQNKIKPEKLSNSFVFDQVFGSFKGRLEVRFKNFKNKYL